MNKLFPILDHLYIFQNFEYEPVPFLKWFLQNPFKRDLQKKHKLIFTPKAILLLIIAVCLILFETYYIHSVFNSLILDSIFLILLLNISPVFLIISWLVLLPLETYQKYQIINAAKNKLKSLPNLKVVAITGSFAKTSTKDILYTLLWKDFRVVKTPKSFNTEISIARTILSDLKQNSEIFLVEMDAYHPGEIKKLANFVKPQMGIITSIAPQHLGRFGSMEKLAKTQFELGEILPKDGVLVLNSENDWIMKLQDQYQVKKVFYGEGGEIKATNIKQTKDGLQFEVQGTNMTLPLFGMHHIQNFLAATAIAQNLGLSLKTIQQRAKWVLPTPHRLEIKKQGNLIIIDNTYNTNPIASEAALEVLKNYPGSQKIIITPGLVELGEKALEENQQFAKKCAEVADKIIIVGNNAKKYLLNGLENYPKDQILTVNTINEALKILPQITKPNAVILLENDLPDQYN